MCVSVCRRNDQRQFAACSQPCWQNATCWISSRSSVGIMWQMSLKLILHFISTLNNPGITCVTSSDIADVGPHCFGSRFRSRSSALSSGANQAHFSYKRSQDCQFDTNILENFENHETFARLMILTQI